MVNGNRLSSAHPTPCAQRTGTRKELQPGEVEVRVLGFEVLVRGIKMQFLRDLKILLEAEKVYPFTRPHVVFITLVIVGRRCHLLGIAETCVDRKLWDRGGCNSEVVFRACMGRCVLVGPCFPKSDPHLPVSVLCCASQRVRVSSLGPHAPRRCFSTRCAGSLASVYVCCVS